MASEQTTIPEPPDGGYALIGEPPDQVLLVRDDAAVEAVRQDADEGSEWDMLPADARWWDSRRDTGAVPLTWRQVHDPEAWPAPPGPLVIQRMFTQAELDRAAELERRVARAEAGLEPVGDHLREPGGYCRGCGREHTPPEWARLVDRLRQQEGGQTGG